MPVCARKAISVYCTVRHLLAVELVALRQVAPRRAAQRPSGAAHSVRSARTGLSQRDKPHLQGIEIRPRLLTAHIRLPVADRAVTECPPRL